MFSLLRITLSATLLLTFGVMLTQATKSVAEDGHQHIEPVPESQHEHADHANCPSCQQSMIVDGQGYGNCRNCNRRGRGIGWCPPGKIRIRRERVQFNKYYPNYWSGAGPGIPQQYAPMVHTPTDTTQLGFYYQHAPSWTAQPWRIPGPAHPAAWHNPYCGSCRNGGYNYGNGPVYYEQTSPAAPELAPEPEAEKPQASIQLQTPTVSFGTLPVPSDLPDAPPEA